MSTEISLPSSQASPTIKLWTPKTISFLTIFSGFPSGVTLAFINWLKMGMKGKAFTQVLGGVIGILILFILPQGVASIFGIVLNLGYMAYLRQQMTRDIEKITGYNNIKYHHWFSGLLISLTGWVVFLIMAISVVFLQSLIPGTSSYSSIDHYNSGEKYYQNGSYDKAVVEFTSAIELNNDYVDAYHYRALAYVNLGKYDLALADLDKAISLSPNNAFLYHVRGLFYKETGEFDKALADQNKAISIDPQYADAYLERGVAYGTLGDHENALADFNKAIELNPNDFLSFYNRGYEQYLLGNYQQAINDFNRAIELNPKYVDAYDNRGITYAMLGDKNKAIADFNKALELDPNNILAYRNRGITYKALGRIDEAIKDYENILELSTDPEVRKQVEDILKELRGQ